MYVVTEKDGSRHDPCRSETEAFIGRNLGMIGDCLPVLRQRAGRIVRYSHLPPVAAMMIRAAQTVDGASLTPMAAVAGAVSEVVKDYLKDQGFDFISVNNGGDVAIFNAGGRSLSVAIGDIRTGHASPYTLVISRSGDYGVATSGLEGRSFTLGVADSVTVIADSAPVADAAATFVANNVTVDSPVVARMRAGDVDPTSDIAGEEIVVAVGELEESEISAALERGLVVARTLKAEGVICDAVLQVKKRMATTIEKTTTIMLEVNYGNT